MIDRVLILKFFCRNPPSTHEFSFENFLASLASKTKTADPLFEVISLLVPSGPLIIGVVLSVLPDTMMTANG
jgi:hypothetical protein